jgi:16S rRNA (guanine(966)-N(2))-methyltransferase RsmD
VLDLYAGSGALGIEALSRGAVSASFVERDSRALSALHRNLRELGFSGRARVVSGSVVNALQRLAQETDRPPFGWVFVDPPYAGGEVEPVLSILSGGQLLAQGAVIIVEHDRHHVPPDSLGTLYLSDRRFYGDTGVSFYRRHQGLA